MNEVDRISSISHKEHVELRSTLHALTNRDFICSQCQAKYANSPEQSEKYRRIKGCEKQLPMPVHKIRQGQIGLQYLSCIGNYFSYSSMTWINFYNSFEQGVLPFEGGYMDQPSKFIDVMNIVGNYKQEQMLVNAQKQKQAAKMMRGKRGG